MLPTRLIWRIWARLPSTMSILIRTLLPGTSSTFGSMRTAYLPRLKYWSVRKARTSSSTERSKVLPVAKPDAAQRLLQVLGLEVLAADELEALDGRSLAHHDDERGPVAPHFDVAEEAGREQGADGLLDVALVEAVADVDRQVVVDRALGNALQAFDADIADREVPGVLRDGDARDGKQHGSNAGPERVACISLRHQPKSPVMSL